MLPSWHLSFRLFTSKSTGRPSSLKQIHAGGAEGSKSYHGRSLTPEKMFQQGCAVYSLQKGMPMCLTQLESSVTKELQHLPVN